MMFKGIEICCPHCKGDLQQSESKIEGRGSRIEKSSLNSRSSILDSQSSEIWCVSCGRRFPIVLGIPDLRVFPDPYIDMEADRAKGLQVAARCQELSFSELVDFYYGITSVVPPRHARQYKLGLMAGMARAEAALTSWESAVNSNGHLHAGSVLDVGCGTAPFLVATASRFKKPVGVDIAFRWLVVAKKRLAEANLEIPLICACAEALPFPDGLFDRVVTDSVLEHFQDQPRALAECYRVMKHDGYLYVSTPNRLSLGPDPHMGLWAGGFLPDRWLAAYVRWQGGIPPKRRLLSARSLNRLLREAAFSPPWVYLPNVSAAQRNQFGKGLRCLIDLYHVSRRLPVSRQLLRWVGPLLHAVAQKPVDSRNTGLRAKRSASAERPSL
jgi:SAM-dependent methyltransferase